MIANPSLISICRFFLFCTTNNETTIITLQNYGVTFISFMKWIINMTAHSNMLTFIVLENKQPQYNNEFIDYISYFKYIKWAMLSICKLEDLNCRYDNLNRFLDEKREHNHEEISNFRKERRCFLFTISELSICQQL